jgi:hypothetical protein
MSSSFRDLIYGYIERSRSEVDIRERIELLNAINSLLPISMRIKIPSLVSNDYIDATLDKIEEEISVYSFALVGGNHSNPLLDRTASHSHYSSLDENLKEIHCDCGNIIAYNDIQFNCDFPEYRILECSNCSKMHKIIVDGKLVNVCGAV